MKYNIIYLDPPWTFATWSQKGKGRSAEQHYDCMTFSDLKQLPVRDLGDNNSAMFMWVTNPMLPQGLELMNIYGYEYKTVAFNWIKLNKKAHQFFEEKQFQLSLDEMLEKITFTGMGYYTRANSELCLLGTRGVPLTRESRSVRQITWATEDIITPREEHSKKPDIIRDKIVQLFGDQKRIELFARTQEPGWDVLGYDIDGRDIRFSIKEKILR